MKNKIEKIKYFICGVIFTMVLSGTIVMANPVTREIVFGVGVTFNGNAVQFEEGTEPFIMDGRTFLPVRTIADLVGLDIDFQDGVVHLTGGGGGTPQGTQIPRSGGTVQVNGTTDFTFNPQTSGYWEIVTSNNTGDPYLWLYDSNGRLIDSNDDGGDGLNSHIRAQLVAGQTYRITAGFYASGSGSYTLTVSEVQMQTGTMPANGGDIQINGTTMVSFTPNQSSVWEVFTTNNTGDPYIIIYDASGEEILRDDDSGGGSNAMAWVNLTAGQNYTIEATFYGHGTGSYTLSAYLIELVPMAGNGGVYNVDGETLFTFTPQTSGIWEFSTSDSSEDPVIVVLTEDIYPIAWGVGEGSEAVVRINLEAGVTYFLDSFFYYGTDGTYTVTVAQVQTITDDALVGRWEFVSAPIYLYFFDEYDDIEFFADGRVISHAFGDQGTYFVLEDGTLIVVSDWFGSFSFTYTISGNEITITDSAGDSGVWRRR